MNKYQLSELDLKKCTLIIDKLDRVVRDLSTPNNEGINHGRAVYWDKKNKLFGIYLMQSIPQPDLRSR